MIYHGPVRTRERISDSRVCLVFIPRKWAGFELIKNDQAFLLRFKGFKVYLGEIKIKFLYAGFRSRPDFARNRLQKNHGFLLEAQLQL